MGSSLDSSMMQASLGQSQGRQLELQNKVRGLNESASSRLTPEQKEKRLREACEGFESIFIQKMWQQMRATLPQNGLLHSRDEKMWQDMYDQELAKSMASVGGIGLADMMYEQLSRNLVSASRGTAGGAGRSAAFVAEAAPLVAPDAGRQVEESRAASAVAASAPAETPRSTAMYDGFAPVSGAVEQGDVPAAGQQAAGQQLAALQPPAAPRPAERQIEVRRHQRVSDQLSGLQMAQQAQRQAGDKLGNGVRPASRRRRQEENAWQANRPVQAANVAAPAAGYAPSTGPAGSPAAMQAAMQPPLTPDQIAQPAAPFIQPGMPGATPVASSQPAPTAAQQAGAQDVVRVRYQTNIPQQAQQLRQGLNQDIIRTLNVDAGGQKAGQGIRAYHAQGNSTAARQMIQTPQAQAAQLEATQLQAQMQQQDMAARQGQAQAAVPPLTGPQATAQAQPQQQMPASGIPPLTAPHASMGHSSVLPGKTAAEPRLSAEEALIAGVPM